MTVTPTNTTYIADCTVPGRMITKGEGLIDAYKGATKETGKALVKGAKTAGTKVANFAKNTTTIGRMLSKGESYGEAWVGSIKAQVGYAKKIATDGTYKSIANRVGTAIFGKK